MKIPPGPFDDYMAKQKNDGKKSEPVFIVRAATKRGGLDYFHITLIALVIILVALAFALSTFRPGAVTLSCTYGLTANDTCAQLPYTNAQVIQAVGRIIAGYSFINGSLSILPYYTKINESNVSYLAKQKEWFVRVPYVDPLSNNNTYNVSFVLYQNLSVENAYLSTARSAIATNNSVVAFGVVGINGKNVCSYSKPIPTYLITDPYAPGTIAALSRAINISKSYAGSVNVSYDFFFSQYAENFYRTYGVANTQQLGDYLACASKQSEFPAFVSKLGQVYNGNPPQNLTYYALVSESGLNRSSLDTCLYNASAELDNQAALVTFYNVTSIPIFIVDCSYEALPQTVDYAINYTLNDKLTTK